MTDGDNIPTGDGPPAQALLGYMKWFSEERWCAGWLIGLHTEMARVNDPPFNWLVDQPEAGGGGPTAPTVSCSSRDLLTELRGE
jgi:hypothetical protein